MKRTALLITGLLLLSACATVTNLSPHEAQQCQQQAVSALGGSTNVNIVMIPSRGAAADATFIAQSRSVGPSAMARQIANYLATAKDRPLEVALVGPNNAKTAQVIADAHDLNRRQDLSRLTIVFMGASQDQGLISDKAHAVGARFVFTEYQSEQQ